jgi:Protein of unknown function (DUF1501)
MIARLRELLALHVSIHTYTPAEWHHFTPSFEPGRWRSSSALLDVAIGRSDRIGAYPATTPFTPDDLGATVYHLLGLDPAAEVHDRLARPVRLNRGEVMQGLFTGGVG